jgi:hypothetical protein
MVTSDRNDDGRRGESRHEWIECGSIVKFYIINVKLVSSQLIPYSSVQREQSWSSVRLSSRGSDMATLSKRRRVGGDNVAVHEEGKVLFSVSQ